MKLQDRPSAAGAADRRVVTAFSAERGRLTAARNDFFLDPAIRLSDHERALMSSLLDGILTLIAGELRSALPAPIAGLVNYDEQSLSRTLASAGLLDSDELVALLLRTADEQRISAAMAGRPDRPKAPFVQGLVAGVNDSIASAAMDLVLGRGRRTDRFGRRCLDFDDLEASLAVQLSNAVAALVRPRTSNARDVEQALCAAVERLLERHDPSNGLNVKISAIVRALANGRQLDEPTLLGMASDGESALLAAALAERASIPVREAWSCLVAPNEGRLAILLRAAGLERSTAARLIAMLAEPIGILDPVREISAFDQFDDESVAGAVSWLCCHPAYRDAVERLEAVDG